MFFVLLLRHFALVFGDQDAVPHIVVHKSLPGYSLEVRRTEHDLCPGSSGLAGYLNIGMNTPAQYIGRMGMSHYH